MRSTNQSSAATRFNRTDGGRALISKQAIVAVVAASGNGRAVGSISRRRHRQRASHHADQRGTLLRQNCARFTSHAEGCWPLRRHEKGNSSCCGTDTRSPVQRFLVVRRRDAAAPARFFTPPVDFGPEPDGFFAPPLNAFFPPDAADFLAMAGDSFFAAVLGRVFVFVPRVFVLDANRFFAVDAPFRERAVAVRLRASGAARRLEASSPGSAGVSPHRRRHGERSETGLEPRHDRSTRNRDDPRTGRSNSCYQEHLQTAMTAKSTAGYPAFAADGADCCYALRPCRAAAETRSLVVNPR